MLEARNCQGNQFSQGNQLAVFKAIISNCSGNGNLLKRPSGEVYSMLTVKTGKKLGSPKSFRRYDKCNMPPFPPYGAILTLLQVTRTIAIFQPLLNFLTRILLKNVYLLKIYT